MSIPISKIFVIFGLVSSWIETATADGRVTLTEAVELVAKLAAVLGIRTELEIPTGISTLVPDKEETANQTGEEETLERERPPPRPI